ncbi:MAG TPA: AraC family transcriptional regulator [Pseudonocardiaceae bacterium]|jgi:AraC-like DNA-binding protein|nr:AraC family transcriptional regulator [Pseudonocardiaceae bacterium]
MPEELTEPPDLVETDALSEVLTRVRLHGAAVRRYAPLAPFGISCVEGTRQLHIVEAGTLMLIVDGRTIPLRGGDLVLLPRGHEHELHTEQCGRSRPLTVADRYLDDVAPGDRPDRWLTGTFAVDDAAADPVLAVLPPALVLRNTPHTPWLPLSTRLLVAEVSRPSPGSAVMISRILDLLFIHALRAWAREDTRRTPGWLTGAADPLLGRAIAALHRDPGHAWSVPELARLSTLSRSGFAERFRVLLGSPPAAYLADVRLRRAAELLRATTDPVSAVARRVGYTSDAAFIRAFTRRYGTQPGRWRRTTGKADPISLPMPAG